MARVELVFVLNTARTIVVLFDRAINRSIRIYLSLAISVCIICSDRAHSMDHHPSIPTIEGTGRVELLSSSGFCQTLANYIKTRNTNLTFTPEGAMELILVLRRTAINLRRSYPSIHELKVAADRNLHEDCKETTAIVYTYKVRPDGSVYRTFQSAPSCMVLGGASGIGCNEFILAPGRIKLQFSPDAEARGLAELAEVYGLAPFMKTVPEGHAEETTYLIAVDVGSEEAWVKLLSRLQGIDEVSRLLEAMAAVNSEGAFANSEELNRLPRTLLRPVTTGMVDTVVQRTIAFFEKKYLGHADITVLCALDARRRAMTG